jgi:hypothetical protein
MFKDQQVIFYQAHVVMDIFYDLSYLSLAFCCWLLPFSGKVK